MLLQLINNGLAAYVFLAVLCVGLAGQFISLRVISLSLVAAVAGGAYGARAVTAITGTNSAAIVIVAGALGGLIVGGAGALVDSCFRRRAPVLALLASLGFLKIVQSVVILYTGGSVMALNVRMPNPFPPGALFATPNWLFIGSATLVVGALVQGYLLLRTPLGTSAMAIGDDIELASLFGVSARTVQVALQALGGAIVGVGGVFMAADAGLRPDLGLTVALKAFAVLIAARGVFYQLFVWAGLVVALEQLVGYFFGGQMREATGLAFLVLALAAVGIPRPSHYRR